MDDPKDNVFMVEKVLDKRSGKAGREEFLIQWQGFPASDSSWEPRENLQCIDLLEEFEKEFAKREKPSRRKLKSPERSTSKQQQSTSKQQPAPESLETPNEEEVFTKDNFSLHGKQLKCIVGITKTPGDLHFLCKFTDDTARLIPAKEVNSRYRPFVDEYGSFLRRQMDKRQKRFEEGKKRTVEIDDEDDEWPEMPEGIDINPEPVVQNREVTGLPDGFGRPEMPISSLLLDDVHMEPSDTLSTSFPPDPVDEPMESGGEPDPFMSLFDESSNSSPPRCSIVVDTIPNDDDLFPGHI
ncbi:hypothetical protein L3Y34_000925 [Caenorhabditis briggsae]|nr:hypothetical protein L3Y34_000925 [Caenorhabditis briggsae]